MECIFSHLESESVGRHCKGALPHNFYKFDFFCLARASMDASASSCHLPAVSVVAWIGAYHVGRARKPTSNTACM